ncbi:MAG: hypothetical protein LC769_10680, partial [Chloroflexi bacterium]|nr:hypothetical protein [Chloroflexota bacterium]
LVVDMRPQQGYILLAGILVAIVVSMVLVFRHTPGNAGLPSALQTLATSSRPSEAALDEEGDDL